MGRNVKEGIDYFPVQVKFNPTMKALLARVGNQGLGTIIRIWAYIYDNKGYYMIYDEDNKYVLADEVREDFDYVDKIVQLMIERDLFSKKLFEEFNILTSEALQNNYKTATRKRISSEIKAEYILISGGRNPEVSPQRKENKTIPNKITPNNNKAEEVNAAAALIESEWNRPLKTSEIVDLKTIFKEIYPTYKEISEAVLISLQRDIKNIKYIEGILKKERDGYKRLESPSMESVFGKPGQNNEKNDN